MTTLTPKWRNLPSFMTDKPKGPWGGGPSDGDDGGKDAGPRNPWAQPPGGPKRAPRPSALDELLKRARPGGGGGPGNGGGAPFQWPGGGNARSLWLGAIGFVVLAWIALTSSHPIGAQEIGVVSYLGKYTGTLQPGWNFTLPAPIATVRKINVTEIKSFSFPDGGSANLVLTADQNLVDLGYSVQWNISDPEKYAFEIAKPDENVKAVAESAVRAVIANTTLDEVIGGGKQAIGADVANAMQKVLDDYQSGVHIVSVTLNNPQPPQQVVDAFKDVTSAQQDAQANINKAKGYAQQVVALAQGQAGAFDRVYAQYKLAPDVTRRRMYYETMEAILAKNNKTIVEPRNLAPLLPIGSGTKATPDAPQGGAR
jgi:modulator of FtsH protease HflK